MTIHKYLWLRFQAWKAQRNQPITALQSVEWKPKPPRRKTSQQVNVMTSVEITATVTLTEGHLRALDALIGYGDDAFLRAFYVKLGRHYMKPFERDLRDLFGHLRGTVPQSLREVEEIRTRLSKAINASEADQ